MMRMSQNRRGLTASIVIRNYNYGAFVADAIDSALAQTYKATEVIVVDDGSTDESAAVLSNYDGACRIIRQSNSGEGGALNAGFAAASGDIVLFVDSDDVLDPRAIEIVAGQFAPGVARVCYYLSIMRKSGALTPRTRPRTRLNEESLPWNIATYGEVPSAGQTGNCYSRSALERILPLDPVVWLRSPESYLNALTSLLGRTVVLDQVLGAARSHDRNLSMSNVIDHKALLIHPNMYDAIRAFVGDASWHRDYCRRLPFYHWVNRLISYRLDRSHHPYRSDSLRTILQGCVDAARAQGSRRTRARIMVLAGLAFLALTPAVVLRHALPLALLTARGDGLFARRSESPERHWRAVYRVPQRDISAPRAWSPPWLRNASV